MSEYYLTESLERYINGEMLPEEQAYFEQKRAQNPELDQLIAEYRVFMQTLAAYADNKNFKSQLNSVHNQLSEEKQIDNNIEEEPQRKIISIWQRYRKTAAIAACIAGLTTVVISSSISLLSPNKNKLEQLSNTTEQLRKNQAYLSNKIKEVTKMPKDAVLKSGGTAFLIDGDGYLITNAHVLKGSSALVTNDDGQEFKTSIVYIDNTQDLAVLKITDDDYQPTKSIPYSIVKNSDESLAAGVFTLGYPSNGIRYNSGYVSALKGYDGDTATIQVSLLANPGNSGGPVFDNNGNVIGILNARETNEQGVTFAIKSREIFKMLNHWRESDSTAIKRISISTKNNLSKMDREAQIKKLQGYVYNVKAYN